MRQMKRSGPVGREELAAVPDGTERILLRMSPRCLSLEGASWLIERDLKLVGVDAVSIDPLDSEDFPAHRLLLSTGTLAV